MQEVDNTKEYGAIGEIEVGPGEQGRILLGRFKEEDPSLGYAIHVTPEPEEDAIATTVTRIEMDNDLYGLVLHVANYGTKHVQAEIHGIKMTRNKQNK